jgi:hypothetical protein
MAPLVTNAIGVLSTSTHLSVRLLDPSALATTLPAPVETWRYAKL